MAFAMAFTGPFVLALLWDLRGRRITTAEELEEQTNAPIVGEIATLPFGAGRSRYFGRKRAGRHVRLFEESVESLRIGLVLTKSLRDAQVLVVTSAATQEGKTTLAAQLAISMARATEDGLTLLVDGDMRAPDIHEIFEVENNEGLADVLGRDCSLADAVVTTWDERLHLLPAGQLKGNPHKLVNTPVVNNLLDEARAKYRYIIIDTAPVLAAGESVEIASVADATLVCTRRDVSRQDQVRKAYTRLSAGGANVVGCVFSGIPLSRYKYRYGGYGYGYRYS
jgi:capsular exopolysaccharide synthesis family protein